MLTDRNAVSLNVLHTTCGLPFFFVFSKTNYARYGSYYLPALKTIENSYPEMKEIMKHTGLPVQGQDKYPLRTSIDQHGEQTINRDAKTTVRIKAFTTKEDMKWSLPRSDQACHTRLYQNLCGLSTDPGIYKPCSPSQILAKESLFKKSFKSLGRIV